MNYRPKRLKPLKNPSLSKLSFNKAQLLAFTLIFGGLGGYVLTHSFAAGAAAVYIAQSAAGTSDGSSCANAKDTTFFNTAANWGTGSTQIGPGTTVHLCGTISTALRALGSGASGSPITIFFEPNAKVSMPVCPGRGTGCIDMNNQNYLIIDGGTNGIIEDTDNGTHLGYHSASYGINATSCNNCEVKNLTIQNIYVHDGSADYTEIDQTQVRAIDFSGNNFLFHDNVVHDVGWAITFGGDNMQNDRLYNNNIYNVDHGITPSFSGSGSTGPFYIYNNHFHDFANWDTTSNAFHHDGIHCFSAIGSQGETINGMYIYNNRFDGDIGGHVTSWIFLEGGSGAGRTPCNNAASTTYIFNNYLTSTPPHWSSNDAINISFGTVLEVNNTVAGPDPTNNNHGGCIGMLPGSTIYNNAIGGCNELVHAGVPAALDYNAYADCSGSYNCWWFNGTDTGSWTTYRSQQPDFDSHSVYNATAAVGSNAAGVGKNLSSYCQPGGADYDPNLVPLCSDINGSPRPTTGAWDAGAVETTVAANVWVSTTGDDSTCVRGDSTKPCATLNQAYLLAQPGDTVQVACGDYPAQQINYDSTKAGTTSYITFEPASTNGICWNQTDKIVIGNGNGSSAPSYIKLSHFSMTGGIDKFYRGSPGTIVDNTVYAYYPATHITIDHQSGGSFGFSAVRDFLVENSDLGNCESEAYPNADGVMTTDFCVSELRAVPSQTGLSNVANPPKNSGSIIYTKFHDISGDISNSNCGSSGCHTTGFAVFGGDGVTFDHDEWWNDTVTGMRFQNFCGCTSQELKNFTIQNSWYDLSGSAFEVNSEVDGLIVRFNSMSVHAYQGTDGITRHAGNISCDAGSMDTNGTPSGVNACGTDTSHAKVYGNIMTNYSCTANTDRSYNILVSFSKSMGLTACDPTETIVSSVPYTNDPLSGQPNFDITGPAWLGDNYVPADIAGGYPVTDYYGHSRPAETGWLDAGAVERATGGTTTPPPTNPPSTKPPASSPPAAQSYPPGDLNHDGQVDIYDLSILLSNYNHSGTSSADIDGNKLVNIYDLSILLSHYGG